jgi:WD40 repeat protein
LFRFGEAHGKEKITACCFDESKRRLLTSANDGTFKMWNFSNGCKLKEFMTENKEEITSICFVSNVGSRNDDSQINQIISAGWDKKI